MSHRLRWVIQGSDSSCGAGNAKSPWSVKPMGIGVFLGAYSCVDIQSWPVHGGIGEVSEKIWRGRQREKRFYIY